MYNAHNNVFRSRGFDLKRLRIYVLQMEGTKCGSFCRLVSEEKYKKINKLMFGIEILNNKESLTESNVAFM